jgi:hypothetical protein
MLLNPHLQLAIPEMDNLFPRQPDDFGQGNAEEALQSHLIIGFEEALGLGMPPMEALGHVLCWVASEMARIRTAQGAQGGAQTALPKAD